ncbi:unnamed protein product [Adineta steineri]|uniref:Uncharacterized protein n=1 Tax=Adineta steineri TaxID=433720 RepID=A0A814LFU0_9BILA|nr:unnamed protein product [Adineta steineri]CAF1064419.1 unnamed protein product [Adineta steineri]
MKHDSESTTVSNNNELTGDNDQQHSFLRRFAKKAAIYNGGAALLGLGATIIGGSFAALWQATHYLPGVFAFVQSASATGAAAYYTTATAVGFATPIAYFNTKKDKNEEKKKNMPKLISKL